MGLPPVTSLDPSSSQGRSAPVVIPTSPGDHYLRHGTKVTRVATHGKHKPQSPADKRRPPSPTDEEQMARMAVAGTSQRAIAKSLQYATYTVSRVLARPDIRTFMEQIREATRAVTLAGVQHAQAGAMEWLGEVVKQRSSKDFDNVTRGVLALEKAGASASGETRANVQVAVINQQTESEEVKALIKALAQ